jgi:hypothetical protein
MQNETISKYNEILESELIQYLVEDDVNDILYKAMRRFEEIEKLSNVTSNDSKIKKEKKLNTKIDIENAIYQYTENEDLQKVLLDFVDMRQEIKKPINTKGTLTRLFNKLDRLSNNNDKIKIELLEKSIINNWQDIWATKDNIQDNEKSFVRTPSLAGQELEDFLLDKNDLDNF